MGIEDLTYQTFWNMKSRLVAGEGDVHK